MAFGGMGLTAVADAAYDGDATAAGAVVDAAPARGRTG